MNQEQVGDFSSNTPSKYSHIDFKPPVSAKKEADKALAWKEKYPDEIKGGTAVGWTRARQLSNRDTLSPDIVRRMVSFFARHEQNKSISPEYKTTPWKDRGYVAWLIWGGDAGRAWANSIVNQMKKVDEKSHSLFSGTHQSSAALPPEINIIANNIRS